MDELKFIEDQILNCYGIDSLKLRSKKGYAAKKIFISWAVNHSYVQEDIAGFIGQSQQNISHHYIDLNKKYPDRIIQRGIDYIKTITI